MEHEIHAQCDHQTGILVVGEGPASIQVSALWIGDRPELSFRLGEEAIGANRRH